MGVFDGLLGKKERTSVRRALRHRGDGSWDSIEVEPDGSLRAEIVDTPEANRRQKEGFTLGDEDFAAAAAPRQKVDRPELRDDVLRLNFFDDEGGITNTTVAEAARRGWRQAHQDEADAFSRKYAADEAAREDAALADVANTRRAGQRIIDEVDGLERARRTARIQAPDAPAMTAEAPRTSSAPARSARPRLAVSTVGSGPAPRAFASAFGDGLPPEVEAMVTRVAGDTYPRGQLMDSQSQERTDDLGAAQDEGALLDMLSRAGEGLDGSAALITGARAGVRANPGAREAPVKELLQRKAVGEADKASALRDAQRDPLSQDSERARAILRAAAPDLLSEEELAGMSAADLGEWMDVAQLRQGVADKKAARAAAAQDASADRASREKIAGMAKRRGAGGGSGAAPKGTVVPGLEVAPGAAPTADDAKKVKTARTAGAKLKGFVSQLRALHDKYGTELVGDVAVNMRQLVKAIQLEAKTISELGALSGPDQQLMEDVAGYDPTSLASNVKGFITGGLWDSTDAALDGLESWTSTQEGAVKDTYGYQDKGAAAAPASGPTQALPEGKVRIQLPNGKLMRVPREKLAEAIRDYSAKEIP